MDIWYADGSPATLPHTELLDHQGRSTTWGELVEQNRHWWAQATESPAEREQRWHEGRLAFAERRRAEWRVWIFAAALELERTVGLEPVILAGTTNRTRPYVDGRRALSLALYDSAKLTMEQIGVIFGQHFTTVSLGMKVARAKREVDGEFRMMCTTAKVAIEEAMNG